MLELFLGLYTYPGLLAAEWLARYKHRCLFAVQVQVCEAVHRSLHLAVCEEISPA